MRSETDRPTAVRRALLLDATFSGVAGLLLLLTAGPLQPILGLPAGLLRGVGIFLIPFAGMLVWIAGRPRTDRSAVLTVVVGNALWVVASVLLLLSGWLAPTLLGEVFVLAQAAAVAVFAYLEYDGLRRERRAPAVEHVA